MEKLKIIDENNIIYDEVKYKAIESGWSCDGCCFLKSKNNCLFNRDEKKFRCGDVSRKDLRNVIWVKDEFTPEPYDEAIRKAKEELKNYLPENEKKLPKSWEKYCKIKENKKLYYITTYADIGNCAKYNTNETIFNKNLIPSYELAEAVLALCQLLQLRDCYNKGWQPDWTDDKTYKYSIIVHKGKIRKDLKYTLNTILTFRTKELRDEFFENFRDLIEIAKPLL